MSTPHQAIYDSALLFCGHKDRMRMRPLLELFAPRTRRGSTSQPNCLCVEESKKERKAVSEKRVVETLITMYNTLNLANFYMCLCMYTSVYSLYISCPVSCLVYSVFLFECIQSNRSVAEQC